MLQELLQPLSVAQIAIYRQSSKAIIVFKGYDVAGKGGVVRELSNAWDFQKFEVHPIGLPSTREVDHPFMRRF